MTIEPHFTTWYYLHHHPYLFPPATKKIGKKQEKSGRALGGAQTSTMQCLIHENISGPKHFLNIMWCIIFGPPSQCWRMTLKIKNSRILIWIQIFTKIEPICPFHHPTCPPSFIGNRAQLFEISCTQTNKWTDRQGWKHNLLPPLVAEVKKGKTWWNGIPKIWAIPEGAHLVE